MADSAKLSALVVARNGPELDAEQVRAWARERLVPYKVPAVIGVVSQIPRNTAMKTIIPDALVLLSELSERGVPETS